MSRRTNNVVVPVGAPTANVGNSRGAMAGFDELDPRLRRIVHQAPSSLTARNVLRHQVEFGVEETERALLKFIRELFPIGRRSRTTQATSWPAGH